MSVRRVTQRLIDVTGTPVRYLPAWRLRYRLLFFASAVLTPAILFGVFTLSQSVDHTRREALNSSMAIAKVIEAELAGEVETTEQVLLTLAQSPTVRAHDAQAAQQLLTDVYSLQRTMLDLAALDQNGTVYASVGEGVQELDSLTADPLFQQAVTTGETAISVRLISTAVDQKVMRLLVPVVAEDNQITGAVMADIALDQLAADYVGDSVQEGAALVVVDSSGVVLLHSNEIDVDGKIRLSDWPSVQAALQGEEGTVTHRNPLDRRRWLWAYTPVRHTGWASVVGTPAMMAYPPLRDTMIRDAASLVVAVALAGLVAMFLASWLATPLSDLTQRAIVVSKGRLEDSVSGVHGSQELHTLAQAINTMSENLATRMNELTAAEEEIRQKSQRVRQLMARRVYAQEEERQRIAADIHDGISQLILGALYETEAAKEATTTSPAMAREKLTNAQRLLEQTSSGMRRIINDLRPPLLDDMGIVRALEKYLRSFREATGVQVYLATSGQEFRLATEVELAFFRVAQEALHNISKHAGTDSGVVALHYADDRVRMTVRDKGVGFDLDSMTKDVSGHMGLKGMEERAESIGASFQMQSAPGQGTILVFDFAR